MKKKCKIECPSTISPANFTCKHCGIPFDSFDPLFQHVIEDHPLMMDIGTKHVSSKPQQTVDNDNSQTGGRMAETSNNNDVTHSKSKARTKHTKNRISRRSALDGNVLQTDIYPEGVEKIDILQFFAGAKNDIQNELDIRREKVRDIKWYLNVRVEMVRDIDDGTQDKTVPHFRSNAYTSLANDDNEHNVNEAFQKMNASLEEFIHKGSNWVVNNVLSIEVNTVSYSPIKGSSYMVLPPNLRFSSGIVNIQNEDDKCFMWSVLAALHPVVSNAQRVSHYEQYDQTLDFSDIEFPVSISKVEKFEKQNKLSINVFGFEEGQVFPLYLTKSINTRKEINLLYISDENNAHYCWIKDLSRFLGHTHKKSHTKLHYCHRCLHGFTRNDLLDAHRPYCDRFDFQKVEFPIEGKNDVLEFKDFHKQMRISFVIYADFESITRKIDTCLPSPNVSSTTPHTKFEACGYAYKVVCSNDKYSKPPVVYRGENAVQNFFADIFKEEEYIKEKLGDIEPLIMSPETERLFKETTHCYICERTFTKTRIKVRDHSHIGLNGDSNSQCYSNYRGAACQSCNLSLQNPNFIPVLFHNFRGFDSHLLLEAVGKYKDKKITCIPNNMQKFISFSVGTMRFLDSYQFMTESLEKLVDNLASEGLAHFQQFQKQFPSEDIAKLLLRKNVYCYDYIDCHDKFNETTLPSREAFFNRLTGNPIS